MKNTPSKTGLSLRVVSGGGCHDSVFILVNSRKRLVTVFANANGERLLVTYFSNLLAYWRAFAFFTLKDCFVFFVFYGRGLLIG